jgi:EF hand
MKLRSALTIGVALAAIATGAHAADSQTVVTHNPDGSTTTTTTRYYHNTDIDVNNNGILDSQEFPVYVYQRWDRDHDGFLSDEEWKLSGVRWYGASNDSYKTVTTWDKNGDGRIDPSEFNVAVSTTKLYDTWDKNANGIVDSEEYSSASFRIYDTNSDGMISPDEWRGTDYNN